MYPPRKDLAEVRRNNLRQIVAQWGGPSALSKRLGYANASYLVQMVGPTPTRDVTEKTATKIEQVLALLPGALSQGDMQANTTSIQSETPPVKISGGHIAVAISAVSQGCERLNKKLSTNKFADVVAFVYEELETRGTLLDAQRVDQLIQLAS